MTDKEHNFAKDINVPHKKQIIIDDIDVSECEHITYKDSFNPMCGNTGICCYGRKNCYFKQLAHKTQECEEYKKRAGCFKDVNKQLGYKYLTIKQECESLKQEIEILQNNFDTATRDCNDEIEIFEQECEELKEEYTELKLENKELYRILADLKEDRKLKDKYKQECEELKKDLQDYESWFDEYKILFTYDGRTPVTNDELYTCLEELVKKGNDETNRYRKALEEIEEYQKRNCEVCYRANTDKCNEGCQVFTILDIINKTKEQL